MHPINFYILQKVKEMAMKAKHVELRKRDNRKVTFIFEKVSTIF